jgi:DNA gyrase subunit A
VADIKQSGRLTQGVKIIDIQKRNDVISSVCVVEHEDDDDDNENLNVNENGTSYENENVNDNENQNENQ